MPVVLIVRACIFAARLIKKTTLGLLVGDGKKLPTKTAEPVGWVAEDIRMGRRRILYTHVRVGYNVWTHYLRFLGALGMQQLQAVSPTDVIMGFPGMAGMGLRVSQAATELKVGTGVGGFSAVVPSLAAAVGAVRSMGLQLRAEGSAYDVSVGMEVPTATVSDPCGLQWVLVQRPGNPMLGQVQLHVSDMQVAVNNLGTLMGLGLVHAHKEGMDVKAIAMFTSAPSAPAVELLYSQVGRIRDKDAKTEKGKRDKIKLTELGMAAFKRIQQVRGGANNGGMFVQIVMCTGDVQSTAAELTRVAEGSNMLNQGIQLGTIPEMEGVQHVSCVDKDGWAFTFVAA